MGCDIIEHGINEVPEIPQYLGDLESVKLQTVKFDDLNQLSITMSVNPNTLSGNERIFQDSLRQRSNVGHLKQIFINNDLNQTNHV